MPNFVNDYEEVFASAARIASENSKDLRNPNAKGVLLILDISVAGGASTLDVKVQMKDRLSGNYVDIPGANFTQKVGTGTDSLMLYPGIAELANREISVFLPQQWRVVATLVGSFTFSISGNLLA